MERRAVAKRVHHERESDGKGEYTFECDENRAHFRELNFSIRITDTSYGSKLASSGRVSTAYPIEIAQPISAARESVAR